MSMFTKLSLITCTVAAIATVYLIWKGTENPGPSFLAAALVGSVVMMVMIVPYCVFGTLAFALRSHRNLSGVLFVIILTVSTLAGICLYVENEAWLNRDRSSEGQRMLPFMVGMAKWFVAVATSAILVPLFFILKHASWGSAGKAHGRLPDKIK